MQVACVWSRPKTVLPSTAIHKVSKSFLATIDFQLLAVGSRLSSTLWEIWGLGAPLRVRELGKIHRGGSFSRRLSSN